MVGSSLLAGSGKSVGCTSSWIEKVIIPEKNAKDLEDIPKPVLKDVEIIPVKHMDEVLPIALHEATPNLKTTRRKNSG